MEFPVNVVLFLFHAFSLNPLCCPGVEHQRKGEVAEAHLLSTDSRGKGLQLTPPQSPGEDGAYSTGGIKAFS
jgi:hypothetical protein